MEKSEQHQWVLHIVHIEVFLNEDRKTEHYHGTLDTQITVVLQISA